MLAAAWMTAVATGLLAAFAVVTAWYARKAFREQAKELGVLQRQVETTRDMLEVQSDQLDYQQRQFNAQKALNAKQTTVLELQARELEGSLDERKRQAGEQRQAQASQVAAWFGSQHVPARGPAVAHHTWGALIRNESALPVLSVRVFFNYIHAETAVSEDWKPIMRGGPVSMIRVLPPRSEQFVEIPDSVRTMIDQHDESTYAVSLEFMDAAGIRWERDARGALKER